MNIPLNMDDELVAEIDKAAKLLGESRSAATRMAIKAGLPVLTAKMKEIFQPTSIDPDVDSPELAEMIRAGLRSPQSPYVKGEFTARTRQRIAELRRKKR